MVYFAKLSFDYFAIHTLFKLIIRLSAKNSRVTYVGMVVRMRNALAIRSKTAKLVRVLQC